MNDIFFLNLRPLEIHHLQEYLRNMNKVNSTIIAVRKSAPILQQQLEPHQNILSMFFPISKDDSNLTYYMLNAGK